MVISDKHDAPVAYLLFRHSQQPDSDGDNYAIAATLRTKLTPSAVAWPIFANDNFDVGRKDVQRVFSTDEPTISSHHLKFRCVVYEDDGEQQVSPMVYVRVLSWNAVRLFHAGRETITSGDAVSKADGDILLNHQDEMQLTPLVSFTFEATANCSAKLDLLHTIRRAELNCFKDQFQVSDRMLGVGGNASVFVAVKQRSKRQVACKIVSLPATLSAVSRLLLQDLQMNLQQREEELAEIKLRLPRRRESLAREYDILKDLNHPNIITLEKVICATHNVYIFEELITGGDLLSYMDQKGALTEPLAIVIVRQLLKAVEYLHSNGIVHRDIKPENVLMTSWRDGARVVLTDFGQARTTDDAKAAAKKNAVFRMQSVVGTHGYTAPEVYRQMKRSLQEQGYSKSIDIWSIGCISATLLTNDLIFPEHNWDHDPLHRDLNIQVSSHQRDLDAIDHGEAWTSIGSKAKSFIKGCLAFDESQRLTAKQALLHPWFTNKHYATEIEAAYERAIEDWKPRRKSDNLIEFIDSTDAVPAVSRTGHVGRFAEEVKSRHFQNVHQPVPLLCTAAKPITLVAQYRHNRTPLPAISEEMHVDSVENSISPRMAPSASISVGPTHSQGALQPLSQAADEGTERLTIVDLAPPQTQFTFEQWQPARDPPVGNDSITQSQSILDEFSHSKLTPFNDFTLNADAAIQARNVIPADDLNAASQRKFPNVAVAEQDGIQPRKKACQ